jgi:hypothetical protein
MRPIQTTKGSTDWPSETFCHSTYTPMATRLWAVHVLSLPGYMIRALAIAISQLVILPFRILVGVIAAFRRAAGVVTGFSLMVIGMALWASPLFILGIPLFILGLLLTLRCLG